MTDFIYDEECYPNVFTLATMNASNGKKTLFEISNRRNDFARMKSFIMKLKDGCHRMVGFNNIGYDYIVLHELLTRGSPAMDARMLCTIAYTISQKIFNSSKEARFNLMIWDNQRIVEQIDLFKIHHFDNIARATSLKVLEFNMEADSIQDLPFPPGTLISNDDLDQLCTYNMHDVEQTYQFYLKSLHKIQFREELTKKHDRNFMNHNDTKIGKDFFIMRLEEEIGPYTCYYYEGGTRKPKQTKRSEINLGSVIFDYVQFQREEFQVIVDWLHQRTIKQTKKVFSELPESVMGDVLPYMNTAKKNGKIKNLNVVVDGFQFDFGTGGIHGSVKNCFTQRTEDRVIIDIDVKSYYPNLAIANRLFPAHLGEQFADINEAMYNERQTHAKKSSPNETLKLALNGTYGDTNNPYSPFYDPQYTMTITINGQLLLCMLAEQLMDIDGLMMIQINTDGLTVNINQSDESQLKEICEQWEKVTGLVLEYDYYARLWIRDVNNYLGETIEGKLKNKGVYEYDYEPMDLWNKNFSQRVVSKGAEAVLVKGISPEDFVHNHDNLYDFFLRAKVPRSSKLVARDSLLCNNSVQLQNTTRYYVSKDGVTLTKVMPPLTKDPEKWRKIAINKTECVTVCNDTVHIDRDNIDYDYYINQIKELTEIYL